jgi:hypothetical protein
LYRHGTFPIPVWLGLVGGTARSHSCVRKPFYQNSNASVFEKKQGPFTARVRALGSVPGIS